LFPRFFYVQVGVIELLTGAGYDRAQLSPQKTQMRAKGEKHKRWRGGKWHRKASERAGHNIPDVVLRVDPNIKDTDGQTCLHLAAASVEIEYLRACKRLLQAGARPDLDSCSLVSPTHVLAQRDLYQQPGISLASSTQVALPLIGEDTIGGGKDVEPVRRARRGQLATELSRLRSLLREFLQDDDSFHESLLPASVFELMACWPGGLEAEDADGQTPLHVACNAGLLRNSALLLTYGAYPFATTHAGFDPMACAEAAGSSGVDDDSSRLAEMLRHLQDTLVEFSASCPPEILLQVFSFLRPHDLVQCAVVSRSFRAIALNDRIWGPICVADIPVSWFHEHEKQKVLERCYGICRLPPHDAVDGSSLAFLYRRWFADTSRRGASSREIFLSPANPQSQLDWFESATKFAASGDDDESPEWLHAVMLGPPGAGKTALLQRRFHPAEGVGDLNDWVAESAAEGGAGVSHRRVRELGFKFGFHDSPSSEHRESLGWPRYGNLEHEWISRNHVVVLCIDLADGDSVKAIASGLDRIQRSCGIDVGILVCGCKADLAPRQVAGEDVERNVREFIGNSLFRGDIGYAETSAVTGFGVEYAFDLLMRMVVRRHYWRSLTASNSSSRSTKTAKQEKCVFQ
jgi:F-box-like/Ras family/Ankyrin repeat